MDERAELAEARRVDLEARQGLRRDRAVQLTLITGCVAAGHLLLWFLMHGVIGDVGVAVMAVIGAAQLITGVLAIVAGVQLRRVDPDRLVRGVTLAAILVGALTTLTAAPVWLVGAASVALRGLDEIEIPKLSHH